MQLQTAAVEKTAGAVVGKVQAQAVGTVGGILSRLPVLIERIGLQRVSAGGIAEPQVVTAFHKRRFFRVGIPRVGGEVGGPIQVQAVGYIGTGQEAEAIFVVGFRLSPRRVDEETAVRPRVATQLGGHAEAGVDFPLQALEQCGRKRVLFAAIAEDAAPADFAVQVERPPERPVIYTSSDGFVR